MPLLTAEMRWFVAGALPADAAAWFAGLGPPGEAEERTDHYLVPAGPDGPGVKVREGGVEVKRRTRAVGVERAGPGVEGAVEAWAKWRFGSRDAAGAPGEGWAAVRKRRWRRDFDVADGRAAPAEGGVPARIERLLAGTHGPRVALELVALELSGAPWWGVGLEATGPGDRARLDALRAAAAHVFGRAAPPALDAARSMGYPAWLSAAAR